MPRDFDSAEPDCPVRFTELVDCPACAVTFEGVFADDSLSVQDLADAPSARHSCPACGHRFTTQLTGWTFYTEAG